MSYKFLEIASTPDVKAAQQANGSLDYWSGFHGDRAFDRFTDAESVFISARDAFYMATVGAHGWPYVQHRGGPAGFLRVLDEKTLAFADFRGNRQYISVGNLAANDRVALFLMDYPGRRRMKIYARAKARAVADDPSLAGQLALPGYKAKAERIILLKLETFDWNCSQHITPRFTEADISEAVRPLQDRLQELETENAILKSKLPERPCRMPSYP